jgi:LmbE family N-acetylglucosaminyl deacetylase
MSIHAHPDAQEFTVGGTLAKWAQAGSTIVTVCITRGTGGSNRFTPPYMTRASLGPIPEAEQLSACRVLSQSLGQCFSSQARSSSRKAASVADRLKSTSAT